MDEWMPETVEYYSALKRKGLLTSATAWMNFEGLSQRETRQSVGAPLLDGPHGKPETGSSMGARCGGQQLLSRCRTSVWEDGMFRRWR